MSIFFHYLLCTRNMHAWHINFMQLLKTPIHFFSIFLNLNIFKFLENVFLFCYFYFYIYLIYFLSCIKKTYSSILKSQNFNSSYSLFNKFFKFICIKFPIYRDIGIKLHKRSNIDHLEFYLDSLPP